MGDNEQRRFTNGSRAAASRRDWCDADPGTIGRIARAIQEHRLGEFADALLDRPEESLDAPTRRLLQTGRQACVDIREQLRVEARAMVERFAVAGIPCTFDEPAAARYPQYHEFGLDVASEHLTAIATVARAAGYWHPLLDDARAWAALAEARDSVVLKRADDVMTRMALRWRDGAARSRNPVIALRNAAAGAWRRLARLRRGRSRQPDLGGFLGTPRPLLAELFAFAGLTADDVLLDVGCGDGRVLLEAARLVGCRGIGVERDSRIHALATAAVARQGSDEKVEIRLGDADSAPLQAATVVFLFVPAAAIAAHVPQMLRRLAPGSRVLAHEQEPITCSPAPHRSAPLIADSAMTVAHLWLA